MDFYNVPRTTAKGQNLLTFNDYYKRLRLLATSVFKWEGLPPEINERYLEQALFMTGKCLFFKNKRVSQDLLTPPLGAYMALQCTPSAALNVYLEPTQYLAVSINYSHNYTPADSVLIKNNFDMVPTQETIRLYSERLTKAERVMDTNLNAQKTPLFIRCEEKQRMTFKNIFAQYDGNEPLIIGDKSMLPESIQVMKTDAPYLLDKLAIYKQNLWNEVMTFLGINNANTDKRERLIVDEATANDQLIATSAEVMLLTRKMAAEQINEMFGLSVSVDLRQQPAEPQQQPGQEEPGQGEGEGVKEE